MSSEHLETVRAYWAASTKGDWAAAGRCVGPGYTWIDHGAGVVARSPEELRAATADAEAWSNVRFDIQNAFETRDGAIVVQAVQSGTLSGPWCSMETRGQQVTFPLCTIFKFDADGRIVFEEAYYDMSAIMRQLGYGPSTRSGAGGISWAPGDG